MVLMVRMVLVAEGLIVYEYKCKLSLCQGMCLNVCKPNKRMLNVV